jgi:shikimate kinase
MGSSTPSTDRHVVLVGMMGTGKSSVGRRLAHRLGRDLVDSDEQVERRTGRTVAEIFRADGEAAFRALESEVLAEALASERPAVVAAAGGTVMDPENRRRIREGGFVVWLRADPSTLESRVRSGLHRPLLDEDPAGVLRRLASQRAPLYAEVADLVVDVDDIRIDDVVERICAGVAA